MPESISRREAARRAGIDESTVRKHIESGALAAAVLSDGRLDAAKVAKMLPRIVSKGPVAPAALTTARSRRLRAEVLRLTDEVEDLAADTIAPAEAEEMLAEQRAILASQLQAVPEQAAALAGRPAPEVLKTLREVIFAALETRAEAADEDEDEWWNEPDEVDVAALAPSILLARRIDLTAQRLEIEHALSRGTLVKIGDVAAAFEDKLVVAKSILAAIPSRLSQTIAAASPPEAMQLVRAEVEGALREL